jgi:hypothetical protein
MNVMTWARRLRRAARPRRSTGLAVESIEPRLAPSPTLPLPPPHVSGVSADFAPPDPCARPAGSFEPPDPCARPAGSFEPPDPC